jgi:hypothetical protein
MGNVGRKDFKLAKTRRQSKAAESKQKLRGPSQARKKPSRRR